MKKLISSAICFTLGLGILSGCGGNDSTTQTTQANKTDSTAQVANSQANNEEGNEKTVEMSEPGQFPIVNEKKEFSVMTAQTSYILDIPTNEFTKWYEEKTNIHINYELVPENAMKEKLNLTLASNALPDAFLRCGVTPSDQIVYGNQGVFLPLNDYIDKYGYYIKEAYEASASLPNSITAPDGNIYALADINECYHCFYSGRAWINQTWLDNLNLKYPETTDEFYEVLKAFKEQDANGNGDPNDEYPMMGCEDGWGSRVFDFLLNSFVYNDYGSRLMLKDGKVEFVANTDDFREGLRYIRKLVEEGLIDPVSLTQTSAQATTISGNPDNINAGVVTGALWGTMLGNDTADPLLRARQYVGLTPLKGPKGVQNTLTEETGITTSKFVITNVCKEPEILFRWADGMFSDEATLMSQIGSENVGWQKPAEGTLGINGKPALYQKIPYTDTTTVQNYHMENIALANRTNDFRLGEAVDPNDPEAEWKQENRLYKETKDRYAPYRVDYQLPPLMLTVEESSERANLQTQIEDYTLESIVGFLAGVKDLEKDWDSYVKEFDNLNLARYLELLQQGYDRQYGNK